MTFQARKMVFLNSVTFRDQGAPWLQEIGVTAIMIEMPRGEYVSYHINMWNFALKYQAVAAKKTANNSRRLIFLSPLTLACFVRAENHFSKCGVSICFSFGLTFNINSNVNFCIAQTATVGPMAHFISWLCVIRSSMYDRNERFSVVCEKQMAILFFSVQSAAASTLAYRPKMGWKTDRQRDR